MRLFILNLLYNILLVPVALTRILIKSRSNPDYRHRIPERLALYNSAVKDKISNGEQDLIWIHCVSVGEFIAAKPLLSKIIEKHNSIKLLITTTTPTGSRLVQEFITKNKKRTASNLIHVYYPYDNSLIAEKFLRTFKPKAAIFFETEIWPMMFDKIKQHHVKLLILNARLSEKSYKGYKKILNFIATSLGNVDFIAAQSDADKSRFTQLGYKNIISTYGNIKYDLNLPDDLEQKSLEYKSKFLTNSNQLVLIAASTHPGEDEIIVDLFKRIKAKLPDLKLIIVPRHPERFEPVYNLCIEQGLSTIKYSGLYNHSITNLDVLLVDTIGKLLYFYNISDLAFIGGSLVNVGGHNPIEPAALRVASVIGHNYHNFQQVVASLAEINGIVIAKDNSELENCIYNLLQNKTNRDEIAVNAYNNIKQHQGVVEKYIKLLDEQVF